MKYPRFLTGDFEAGRYYQRKHQHRIAWLKLFCLIVLGTFCGMLLFNLVGMFV